MSDKTNLLFVFADQLRASSLPVYGENQIETPNITRLAEQGVTFTNSISTCPVCTPYRSMLLLGRHPQTTGHIMNFVCTRHDEISIGDAFSHAGYKTGWVGKWHLHTGSFPQINGPDYVPEGRNRLGFQYWRGYNFHMDYFNGTVNIDDWRYQHWTGYETNALNQYAIEFMEGVGDNPFCLFISPHQPHFTPYDYAPKEYYKRLPDKLHLPENVPDDLMDRSLDVYRHYLAMTLALDDMMGELIDYLDRTGKSDNTLVVFTSDHGTQMGAQGWHPFQKKVPYEESLLIPMIIQQPGVFDNGGLCDTLTAPVDMFPSLCSLCDVPIPRTVEGYDLSGSWLGEENSCRQDAVLTMNFTKAYDFLVDGEEWRGVRTKDYSYSRWLNGTTELFDLRNDPLEMENLAGILKHRELEKQMESQLQELMTRRNESMIPCTDYGIWYDNQRRIIRNVYGELGDPEQPPDWSLLTA
ncbi:sulfatase-like hydrolase/transferase [Candidatus Poribacteria bacterium]|nr:sulfatase-like hydrolase/transferase [Candidatus Poribacteria bacterium]